jgi:multiple sugar transport system substrate-binding protein
MVKNKIFNLMGALLTIILVTACTSVSEPTIIILPTSTQPIPTYTPIPEVNTPKPTQPIIIPDQDKFKNRIEVTFWYPWAGKTSRVVEGLVSEFNVSNPWNVRVMAFQNGDDNYLAEKVIASLHNGQRANIIAAQVGLLRSLYLDGNELVDLTAYVGHPKWGITEQDQVSYPLTFWQQDMVDNARFGLPAQRNAYFLFYNQTWAHQLGFDSPPSTPDDLLNQSCAAARQNSFDNNPDNDGTGGWIFDSKPMTVLSWMKSFGGGEMPGSEKEIYRIGNTANEKAFAFLQQMARLGCAWVPKDQDPYLYFTSRKALFYSGTLQDILIQKENFTKDDWTILPYPSLDGHEIILADGLSYGILKTDTESDLAAWLFIRWMQKPENQAKMINASSTYPLTSNIKEKMEKFSQSNPAWTDSLQYLPLVKTAPLIGSWLDAGKVLQDAAWQVIQSNIKPGDISGILLEADELIKELTSN